MIWNSVSFPTCEKRNPRILVAIQQDPHFTASTQVSESWCWARAAQEFGEGGGGAPWENSRGLWSATSLIRKGRSFKTMGKGKSTTASLSYSELYYSCSILWWNIWHNSLYFESFGLDSGYMMYMILVRARGLLQKLLRVAHFFHLCGISQVQLLVPLWEASN